MSGPGSGSRLSGEVLCPARIAQSLTEFWSPRVIARVNDAFVKVAKLEGSLTWHSHAEEDELFFVLSGRLRLEMESRVVDLQPGEMFVVPRGLPHNPIAHGPCEVLLVELQSTQHTGDRITEKTRSIEEQLRGV
jgi:mannose-6-phosphate isomerase-like protein (cupin superfamily)